MREGRKNGYEQRGSRQENAARYRETEYDPKRAKRSQKARKGGSRQSAQETKNSLELLYVCGTVSGAAWIYRIFSEVKRVRDIIRSPYNARQNSKCKARDQRNDRRQEWKCACEDRYGCRWK